MRKLLVLIALLLMAAPGVRAAQMADRQLGGLAAESVRTYAHYSIFDDVTISVMDRAVTLTGRVTSPQKRIDIGARVAKIDGVRGVTNDIGVLPDSPLDANIRTRIASAIYNHPSFWRYASMANPPIHIIVEHARVTLTGAVGTEVDRRLAYSLALVDGTLGVTNELRIDK